MDKELVKGSDLAVGEFAVLRNHKWAGEIFLHGACCFISITEPKHVVCNSEGSAFDFERIGGKDFDLVLEIKERESKGIKAALPW